MGILISSFISHPTNHQGLCSISRLHKNDLQLLFLLSMPIIRILTLACPAHCNCPKLVCLPFSFPLPDTLPQCSFQSTNPILLCLCLQPSGAPRSSSCHASQCSLTTHCAFIHTSHSHSGRLFVVLCLFTFPSFLYYAPSTWNGRPSTVSSEQTFGYPLSSDSFLGKKSRLPYLQMVLTMPFSMLLKGPDHIYPFIHHTVVKLLIYMPASPNKL